MFSARRPGEVVENAVSAANALETLDRCADVPLLRAVVKPPEDPDTRREVAKLRDQVRRRQGTVRRGPLEGDAQEGAALVDEARASGYQPLTAEGLALTGMMQMKTNDPQRRRGGDDRGVLGSGCVSTRRGPRRGRGESGVCRRRTSRDALPTRVAGRPPRNPSCSAWADTTFFVRGCSTTLGAVLQLQGEKDAALRLNLRAARAQREGARE